MDSVVGRRRGGMRSPRFSEPPAEPSLQDDFEADGAAPASVEEGASAGNHFASERVEELLPDEESADGGAGGASYSDGGRRCGRGGRRARPSDAEDAEEGAPAASRADGMFSEDAPVNGGCGRRCPGGRSRRDRGRGFCGGCVPSRGGLDAPPCGACRCSSAAFAASIGGRGRFRPRGTGSHGPGRCRRRGAGCRAGWSRQGAVDPLLPYIDMRFTSFSRAGFPTVSAGLQFSMPDGSPPGPGSHPSSSRSWRGRRPGVPRCPWALPASRSTRRAGACQMSYTADTAQLTGSRTVKVSLSPRRERLLRRRVDVLSHIAEGPTGGPAVWVRADGRSARARTGRHRSVSVA